MCIILKILEMYITMLSIILGGILNMLFCKTKIYQKYNIPIDFGKTYKGKQIFGNNKTWIGFISMIVFCIITQILWGFICKLFSLQNNLYINYQNNIYTNFILGFCFGFLYMLFELPNSFIKRRLNIKPGKTENKLFFVIDQIDSLIGVMLVLFFTSNINFITYLNYVILGGITHIIINLCLYKLKIRKNL